MLVSKLRSGTSKTTQLVPVHLMFGTSTAHLRTCATCKQQQQQQPQPQQQQQHLFALH